MAIPDQDIREALLSALPADLAPVAIGRIDTHSKEAGQSFHAKVGTDSMASWAFIPRVGQCDRRVSWVQVCGLRSRDFAALLRMLSPASCSRWAL